MYKNYTLINIENNFAGNKKPRHLILSELFNEIKFDCYLPNLALRLVSNADKNSSVYK